MEFQSVILKFFTDLLEFFNVNTTYQNFNAYLDKFHHNFAVHDVRIFPVDLKLAVADLEGDDFVMSRTATNFGEDVEVLNDRVFPIQHDVEHLKCLEALPVLMGPSVLIFTKVSYYYSLSLEMTQVMRVKHGTGVRSLWPVDI